jgi:hypothetical protein
MHRSLALISSGMLLLTWATVIGGHVAMAQESGEVQTYPDVAQPPVFSTVAEAICKEQLLERPGCLITPASVVLTGAGGSPPITFAKVVCRGVDENGCARTCECTANQLSHCTTFVTRCAEYGGNVSGNKQSATCDQSELCAEADD